MNDRELAIRLARRLGIGRPAAEPGFGPFLGEAVRHRWSVEEAEAAWKTRQEAEEVRRASPGGLGAWAEEWDACRRCGLHRTRSRVVHGRGSVPADVLVVGEGPGPEEDRQGVPFVGPAGFMLDRALREFGEDGSSGSVSFYVANLVACYMGEIRRPEAVEVDACLPRLLEVVRTVQPWVVLLVGAQPLYHLLGLGPVEAHRGKLLAWEREGLCVHAVATWHPAGVLRSQDPARMRQIREDVRVVRRAVEGFRSTLF